MNKLFIVAVVGLLIISALGLYCHFDNSENFEEPLTENKKTIGLTPEQEWRIIKGEDVGIVLNLKVIDSGTS